MLYKPPFHKLLPMEARSEYAYKPHASEEAQIWNEEFQDETLEEYVEKTAKLKVLK